MNRSSSTRANILEETTSWTTQGKGHKHIFSPQDSRHLSLTTTAGLSPAVGAAPPVGYRGG